MNNKNHPCANSAEYNLEKGIFLGRWLLAPFYIGILMAILILLAKFFQEFLHALPNIFDLSESSVVLLVLSLVDMALVANLLLMVAFVGYDHFVSDLMYKNDKDYPTWLGSIDYNGLKLKAVGSIAAISAIQLLRVFVDIKQYSSEEIMWMVIIHLAVALSGVLLAVMDKLAHAPHVNEEMEP